MFDRLFALETFGIKLGLENISRLCAALGNPERTFRTLHVAGTNGKGSVTAMTHAALLAAGLRSARYTSPHLVDLAERFVIGPDPVDVDTLGDVTGTVLDLAERLRAEGALQRPPTFFEATTAIAFELFRRAAVEVAVIEVGLGGRFDATNVINPVAGAITSIAFDHQQHLGSTLDAIAFEKAGIIKSGMTVVTGALPVEAMARVRAIAAGKRARLIEAPADTEIRKVMREGRAELAATTPEARYGPLLLALRGEHQVGNAVVAIRLLEAARAAGVPLSGEAIERGLTHARWPARLELVALADGRRVLLDAAHNVEGAQALAAYLASWHPERPTLVLGIMRDKDAPGILQALLPVTSRIIVTAPPSPRALPPAELAAAIALLDPLRNVAVVPAPLDAVNEALRQSGVVCVAGSIFLAGAVRDRLEGRDILQ